MRSALHQLDAFTDRRFAGNPAAVMPTVAPDDATMRGIAAENNLAETAFLERERAGDDHRLRWFTPPSRWRGAGTRRSRARPS